MRTCYVDTRVRAIADVYPCDGGWMLSRINVPREHRGHGFGSELLRRVLADADAEDVTLFLTINPSGGLSYGQLHRWYARNGFRQIDSGGLFRRYPQRVSGESGLSGALQTERGW